MRCGVEFAHFDIDIFDTCAIETMVNITLMEDFIRNKEYVPLTEDQERRLSILNGQLGTRNLTYGVCQR